MVLGALAACVVALAAYVLTTNTVKDRQAQLEAATAQADATSAARQPAQAVRRLPGDGRDPHPDRQGPRVLALRLGAGAARHLARHPGRRHAARAQRHDLQRRRRRQRRPQRDRRSGDRAQGLHAPARSRSPRCCRACATSTASPASASTSRSSPTSRRPPAPVADRRLRRRGRLQGKRPPNFEIVMFFEGAEVPATVEDITVQPGAGAGAAPSAERHDRLDRAAQAGGVTTPPADPAADDTATPASTPAGRGSPMTRSNKILLSVVALGAAIAAFYFLVLAPKREEVAKLDTEIADPAGRDRAGAADARRLRGGARRPTRRNYATLARLGKAVPADDDVRSLLVQLEATADRSGVDFEKIELGERPRRRRRRRPARRRPRRGQLASAPGAVPVAGGALSAMPFNFSFTGAYFDLSAFFARLEHFVTVNNAQARRDRPPAAPGERLDHARRRRVPGHAGRDQRRDLPRPAGPGRRRARARRATPQNVGTTPGTTPPTTTASANPEPHNERRHHHLAPARAPPAVAGRRAAARGARRRPGAARP